MTYHARSVRRPQIDERGREGEHGRQDEADGIRHLEPGIGMREEDSGGSECMESEESAGGEEGERDQEDAGIAATVRRGACGVGEHEQADSDCQEDREVDAVVRPIRVELLTQQERDETDER